MRKMENVLLTHTASERQWNPHSKLAKLDGTPFEFSWITKSFAET